MNQTISILGCGWLGLPLAISLFKEGYLVKGSTTSYHKLETIKSSGVVPYLIDLNSIEKNISEFLKSEILIINITSKNTDSFKNLMAKIELSPVKKVLFISSISVYDNNNLIVTEKTPTNKSPLSEIESLFFNHKEFKTNILRFGGLFGYNRKPGNFISSNKKMKNPEGYVNLIHRDDCIRIIEQIILKNIWGEIFNACADSHPKRRDFYIKEVLKLRTEKPIFDEDSLNIYKIVSVEKLKSMLNFNFKYPDLMKY
ncbi:MAG: hypothetical protein HQ471_04580 [Flavobacteriales bacterium]|nr:hypothetical protein [Flavobacteriales bacterium]